ncbi:MAG: type I glutamate--ammonia ligase [Gemmatimonadetes bacterium RIFCSPLOWO2_02_FULL_71_11]|nr:MAG: type I glutamate--ammonia ligase [Gemmatimonadetes bacterium RIFCSPLOWO2_02_FULL_71_11]
MSDPEYRALVESKKVPKRDVLALVDRLDVRYLQLQFTDIMGIGKNVEVPRSQFEKALDGQIMFDGSSIEGFVRIEESDMLLEPDLDTFRIYPWGAEDGLVARLICDIRNPDESAFPGCPRSALKRQIARAKKLGFEMMAGCEAEFFLFTKNAAGEATTDTHDAAGYFDLGPVDRGERARRLIVDDLEEMGFEVEAAHHEVAPGQHEVDFRYADALKTADDLVTFRQVVRSAAERYDLVATFMPKPIFGQNGSGMHTHQSLFKDGKNAFWDAKAQWELSKTALSYIAGLLTHARGFCAVTNPLVNSYKRLVPGYEAPVNVAWSMRNRSPLVRIPDRREAGTRCELRMPDPAANPYLALAVQLAAGLDGIEHKLVPPDPVNKNIFKMTYRERRHYKIDDLPRDVHEALDELERDKVILDALGEHIASRFIEAKRAEWQEYIAQVSEWEVRRYLGTY